MIGTIRKWPVVAIFTLGAVILCAAHAVAQNLSTGTETTTAPDITTPLSTGSAAAVSPEILTTASVPRRQSKTADNITTNAPGSTTRSIETTTTSAATRSNDISSSPPVLAITEPANPVTSPAITVISDAGTTAGMAIQQPVPDAGNQETSVSLSDGVVYQVVRPGMGEEAPTTGTLLIHYTLYRADGTKIESSRDALFPVPFEFQVGQGEAIKGMELGTKNMRIGEVRKLFVPAAAGYGSEGLGKKIAPNTDLLFDVELVDIKK